MAVASISVWRARDGRQADFMANVATAKKIHERMGAKVRIWQTLFGPQTLTVGYVIEHRDWAAFADFTNKLQTDTEWQEFFTGALADPSADWLQNSLVSEIENL
jgi:hypothetical protein